MSCGASFTSSFFLMACLMLSCSKATEDHQSYTRSLSSTPPRGWNSYDSYSWVISEREFLRNAQLVAEKLLPFGYEYVVVDFLWYRRTEPGVSTTTPGFDHIDKWGRPIPDAERWPSSAGGRGFKPVADRVHSMGLKFGLHVMRGISTQAVIENTPILAKQGGFMNRSQNRIWRARDIALQNEPCSWMAKCFVSVNESTDGGKAFIQSLYDLYASWGVDYVKHDCVFGVHDLSVKEITAVSEAITATGRSMIYSISPGVRSNPSMASVISGLVNMFRITGDDWDSWSDLASHFDVARDFAAAGLIGAQGLHGFSWPDLDMLPVGYLTDPGANHGPNRLCGLTLDEQRTQMTLWAMAKSPLMFGGDMINLDQTTLRLLTEPTILEINANSFGNMEVQVAKGVQSVIPIISLLQCKDAIGTRWSLRYSNVTKSMDQLCWMALHEGEIVHEGCLAWDLLTPMSLELEHYTTENVMDMINISGRAHICDLFAGEFCLDAEASRSDRLSSLASNSFSMCSQNDHQIWHLKPNGKLMNKGTELCAVVIPTERNVPSVMGKRTTRTWIAHGPDGEYYIAFFNLGKAATNVSVSLGSIIGEGLPDLWGRSRLNRAISGQIYECTGREVWSDHDIGTIRGTLLTELASHGCTLFSLQCSLI